MSTDRRLSYTSEQPSRFDEFDPMLAEPERVKTGADWVAVFKDPASTRITDVDLVHTIRHTSVVCAVRFSPDGTRVATCCNRTTQIFDTTTGTLFDVLDDTSESTTDDVYIRCLSFSPDGKYIVTGAEDTIVRLWVIGRSLVHRRFIGHRSEVYGVDFSPNGQVIASVSDNTVCLWNVDTEDHRMITVNTGTDQRSSNDSRALTSVAFSPDGRYLAAGCLDTAIYILDSRTGQVIQRLMDHIESVYSVAFTPDGKGVISGSLDKTMKYWDFTPSPMAEDGMNITTQPRTILAKDYVLSVAISGDDGGLIAFGARDKTARIWNSQTGETELMIKGHNNSVISVDLSPDGRTLVTGSGNWSARIWRLTTIY